MRLIAAPIQESGKQRDDQLNQSVVTLFAVNGLRKVVQITEASLHACAKIIEKIWRTVRHALERQGILEPLPLYPPPTFKEKTAMFIGMCVRDVCDTALTTSVSAFMLAAGYVLLKPGTKEDCLQSLNSAICDRIW